MKTPKTLLALSAVTFFLITIFLPNNSLAQVCARDELADLIESRLVDDYEHNRVAVYDAAEAVLPQIRLYMAALTAPSPDESTIANRFTAMTAAFEVQGFAEIVHSELIVECPKHHLLSTGPYHQPRLRSLIPICRLEGSKNPEKTLPAAVVQSRVFGLHPDRGGIYVRACTARPLAFIDIVKDYEMAPDTIPATCSEIVIDTDGRFHYTSGTDFYQSLQLDGPSAPCFSE